MPSDDQRIICRKCQWSIRDAFGESNDQDKEQEVGHEATEFLDHESNDQNLFSEFKPEQYSEQEMQWIYELEFVVEVSINNEESYQLTQYFKKKQIAEGSEASTRPQRARKVPVRQGYWRASSINVYRVGFCLIYVIKKRK